MGAEILVDGRIMMIFAFQAVVLDCSTGCFLNTSTQLALPRGSSAFGHPSDLPSFKTPAIPQGEMAGNGAHDENTMK